MSKYYGMIPRTTVVWFYSFSGTSYVVPIVLYIAKKVSHSNMHVKSENQNTKRRVEIKSIPCFCFWIKWCWRGNSTKKTSSMTKDSSNLSKPCWTPGCARKGLMNWSLSVRICSLVFSETQHGIRSPCLVVCDRARFFLKNVFTPKVGKMGQKQGLLNFLEHLVINFFWIWSI